MKKFRENIQNFVHYFPKKEIVGDLEFITDPTLPIQFGIHEPKTARVSKLHYHKFFVELFYVERGSIVIEFTDSNFKSKTRKKIKEGESFVMLPGIGHRVYFSKGCRVLEIHQGPFVNEKVFQE